MAKSKNIYRQGTSYIPYLIAIATFGLAYGLNKGVMDNYLAEIVGMGEFDRGLAEFFRELPGFLSVGVLALLYMFSVENIFKIGSFVLMIGMAMLSFVPAHRLIVILSIMIWSFGDHLQIGMRNTIGVQYAKPGKGGQSLGKQMALQEFGTLAGFIIITVMFMFVRTTETTYRIIFAVSAAFMLVGSVFSTKIKSSKKPAERKRFYFRKKYTKYYLLEVTYGARKQVFFTFGPYLLVLHYGANVSVMSLLFAISAICCTLISPVVGKLIDKIGYKKVMVSDTMILVFVCFFYGFAEHLFPRNVAFIVCCTMYILDSIISLASMASNVYVQDLSDNEEEARATITTGLSVNHFVTIMVALFGGWVWQVTGIEVLFTISAVIGLMNSTYAMTIKTSKQLKNA